MTADLSLLSLPLTSLLCLPFAFLFNANLALSPLLCSPSSHGEARNEIQNSQERGSLRCGRFWRLFLLVESFWTAMGAQHIPHEMPPRQQSSETPIAAHPTSWRWVWNGQHSFLLWLHPLSPPRGVCRGVPNTWELPECSRPVLMATPALMTITHS